MTLDSKERLFLIKRNSVEILGENHLQSTLKKKNLLVYCGYETSGDIHIGTLVTILKLLDFQKAGIKPLVLLADWHTWLNRKGDWNFINKQMENWQKGIKAVGLKAKFIKGTSFQQKKEYFEDILTLALNTTVTRGIRSMQTVARDIEHAKISQIIYPLMQITDIKHLDLDFVVSGLDQRKIHALGVETFDKINFKKKPIFIHTGIITSLKGPGSKMSSSIPESMISIKDSASEISKKIKKAHCPPGSIKENPILEISKYLLFPKFGELSISRSKEHGGNKTYTSYTELEKDFESKKLHPLDLKNSVSSELDKLISPIRKSWK